MAHSPGYANGVANAAAANGVAEAPGSAADLQLARTHLSQRLVALSTTAVRRWSAPLPLGDLVLQGIP